MKTRRASKIGSNTALEIRGLEELEVTAPHERAAAATTKLYDDDDGHMDVDEASKGNESDSSFENIFEEAPKKKKKTAPSNGKKFKQKKTTSDARSSRSTTRAAEPLLPDLIFSESVLLPRRAAPGVEHNEHEHEEAAVPPEPQTIADVNKKRRQFLFSSKVDEIPRANLGPHGLTIQGMRDRIHNNYDEDRIAKVRNEQAHERTVEYNSLKREDLREFVFDEATDTWKEEPMGPASQVPSARYNLDQYSIPVVVDNLNKIGPRHGLSSSTNSRSGTTSKFVYTQVTKNLDSLDKDPTGNEMLVTVRLITDTSLFVQTETMITMRKVRAMREFARTKLGLFWGTEPPLSKNCITTLTSNTKTVIMTSDLIKILNHVDIKVVRVSSFGGRSHLDNIDPMFVDLFETRPMVAFKETGEQITCNASFTLGIDRRECSFYLFPNSIKSNIMGVKTEAYQLFYGLDCGSTLTMKSEHGLDDRFQECDQGKNKICRL